jgi:phytanoyl-CoA hydroxylase
VSNHFTDDELAQCDRDGCVIARGLVDEATIRQMRDVALEHVRGEVPPIEYEAELHYPGAPTSLEVQGGHTIRRLKYAIGRGFVFSEWMLQPAVLRRLQQLLGPRVVCPLAHHNCIMTKQPRFSSDTGWHQDIRYWSFQRPELITAWIALGDERDANGGLWVIPGSHRLKLSSDQFDEEKFFRADLPQNQPLIATHRSVELSSGDVLFFHCLTLHAASRNATAEPKFSVVFTFRSADNLPLAGTRSAALPELVLTPSA